MAIYTKSPTARLSMIISECLIVISCSLVLGLPFIIGLTYLPEFLEKRDGVKHMNIYGIRG